MWEPAYDPQLSQMTLEDYARSPRMEYNWMTRSLNNHWNGDLTREHLDIAKTIIRRKCLVGLLEEKEESLRRFSTFFHWDRKSRSESKCKDNLLHRMWPNRKDHEGVEEGSLVWGLLERQNAFDVELYEYAKIIFHEQAAAFL